MSKEKEVQSNSVTYKRKDYLNFLADTENALSILATLRQKQIDEWEADTAAREADCDRLLREKFYCDSKQDYYTYQRSLTRPIKWEWLYRLLGRPLPVRVDEFGSVEAYADANLSFEEFVKEDYWGKHSISGEPDAILKVIKGMSEFGYKYVRNEWQETLAEVQKSIRDVECSNHDATFTIPRETFDEYAGAQVAAESPTLEPMPEATLRWSLR